MAWLSNDWAYRREITIDNTSNSNDLTDYQVKITLDNTNFDFSKANNDGSDIRFTDDDGSTLLYYWIEKWDSTNQEAIIWVKVPSIPASSNKTIYMYYGNASASDASDGDNTFEFFDDASGTYSDKWVTIEGSADYATVDGKPAISLNSSTTNIRTKSYQSNGAMIIEAELYTTEVITAIQYYQDDSPSTNERYHARIDVRSGEKEAILKDGNFTGSEKDVFSSPNTWVSCKLIRDENGNHKWYVGGVLADERLNDTTYTSGYLALNHHNSGTGAVANLRVRKYADPEPTTSIGTEQAAFCISGQVTLNGNPVENAKIRVICQDDNTYFGDTTTDANGNYKIEGVVGSKKYHIVVEYTDGSGNKYNAESKWDITPYQQVS